MFYYTKGKGKLQIREKAHHVWITCGQYVYVDRTASLVYNTFYERYIPAKEKKEETNPRLSCKVQVYIGEKNDPA